MQCWTEAYKSGQDKGQSDALTIMVAYNPDMSTDSH